MYAKDLYLYIPNRENDSIKVNLFFWKVYCAVYQIFILCHWMFYGSAVKVVAYVKQNGLFIATLVTLFYNELKSQDAHEWTCL